MTRVNIARVDQCLHLRQLHLKVQHSLGEFVNALLVLPEQAIRRADEGAMGRLFLSKANQFLGLGSLVVLELKDPLCHPGVIIHLCVASNPMLIS